MTARTHIPTAVATVALVFAISPAMAAPASITSATLVGTTNGEGQYTGDTTITGFSVGSTDYSVITGATAVTLSETLAPTVDDPYEPYEPFWKGTQPATNEAALIGTRVDDGQVNFSGSIDLQFGRTVAATDTLFIIDLGTSSGDDVTVQLLDATGQRVGDFERGLLDGQFDASNLGTVDAVNTTANFVSGNIGDQAIRGVAFSLSDFPGTGTPSGVTGLRLIDAGNFDPAVVGIAVVPEPASAAALMLFAGAATLRRRRY